LRLLDLRATVARVIPVQSRPPSAVRALRFDVDSLDSLRALVAAPLPVAGSAGAPARRLRRDLYLDTPDDALHTRGLSLRLRCFASGRQLLSLRVSPAAESGGMARTYTARVRAQDPLATLAERTGVMRRVRGVVDPAAIEVRLSLEVEEFERGAGRDWLLRPRWRFRFQNVTVREQGETRAFQQLTVQLLRGDIGSLSLVGDALRDTQHLRPVHADTRARAEFVRKWMRDPDDPAPPRRRESASPPSREWPEGISTASPTPSIFLNSELGHLEFISRVLALAEEEIVPRGERLKYLAIVASNLDEFFMVRVAGLVHATEESVDERADDGLSPREQLDLISLRAPPLVARLCECARTALAELAVSGTRVRPWVELSLHERSALRERFLDEISPELTPMAVTLSPGHPIPRLQHLSLALGAMITDRGDRSRSRFVNIELPATLPRFLGIEGTRDLALLEDVVRGNLDVLYPDSHVEEAHLFRVTRGGEMAIDERQGDDLLDIVSEATRQRPDNPVVRVEVERAMPSSMRQLLLDQLRRERGGASDRRIGRADLYEADGMLDLRALAALSSRVADDPGALHPQFSGVNPLSDGVAIWDLLRERDRLVHHPFDSFDATVLRFLRTAAADPDVTAIKITLYRLGDDSPIADALLDAAARGKQVIAFVELKARFDEERNVAWARRIENAGGRVIYGLIGLKNHSKVALVVRREGERPRRYVHVGTGNYNAATARAYTDLSLFSADESLAADVADFFNELTGSSKPPARLTRGALVAPKQMRRALIERIERETEHARAGRRAAIRMKMNGLSDPDIVRALYAASRAGVECDLIIRGICTLRPGIAGLSDRIRVLSVVGRFLEHSRVYTFANGGAPEYFIGSADLRTRNLRRRVELLVPVREPGCRALLDSLLDGYLGDPAAWRLQPHGGYTRGARAGSVAQERWMDEAR
jgi:polyphosphate kinase